MTPTLTYLSTATWRARISRANAAMEDATATIHTLTSTQQHNPSDRSALSDAAVVTATQARLAAHQFTTTDTARARHALDTLNTAPPNSDAFTDVAIDFNDLVRHIAHSTGHDTATANTAARTIAARSGDDILSVNGHECVSPVAALLIIKNT